MHEDARQVRQLIGQVRSRWRRLVLLQALVRAALAVAGVLVVAVALGQWAARTPFAFAAIGALALTSVVAAAAWVLWSLRAVPSDRAIARFVEEHEPGLDDRLATAVDLLAGREDRFARLGAAMLGDAARAARQVDAAGIIPGRRTRRAGAQALAALLLLCAVGFTGRGVARQSADAVLLTLFPSRLAIVVSPGSTRLPAGSPLTIDARVEGGRAPVAPRVLRLDGEQWRETEMARQPSQDFRLSIPSVQASFKYRVAAGTVTSPTYDVTVARAPRVTKIDVEYRYPAELGLAPRTEQDSGDIYGPAGTRAQVRVHTDVPAASGQMTFAPDKSIGLSVEDGTTLSGGLEIVADGSYRVALAGPDGLRNPGDTEYFIRVLADRPPDVHIVKPARDRTVTRLDEVDIEAEADDDYGIARLEFVYGINGAETVVPIAVPPHATSVKSAHTLYLEDLDIKPGDLVSYYVRARDLTRGPRGNEARSNLFFLDVRPFEREFALSQNQNGAGGSSSMDDLVAAQKQVVVATWKLDRRARAAEGASSEQDIKSVSRAESELQARVQQMSSSLRESTMRDPRQSSPGRGPRVGQSLPEEDAMGLAAAAMGRAVGSLDALKTAEAVPPELEALDKLLKAQGDVKKREISNQQAGAATANNRSNVDASSMFDRELQRQQQTNYENRQATDDKQGDSMLDKIRDLAERQDELNRKQQELANRKSQLSPDELRRELEKLTREQSDLRQRAEDLARQMDNRQNASGRDGSSAQQDGNDRQPSSPDQRASAQQAGQQPSGQPGGSTGGASAQRAAGQPGGGTEPGAQTPGAGGQGMRDVSEEMRNAAGDLRRQDPGDASRRGAQALEKLQALARQMQNAGPDERQRALGDLQLEARQLADAERRAASELARAGTGEAGADALRRLAGDQERLAARAARVQEGLQEAAAASQAGPGDRPRDQSGERAAGGAARDLERQRLTERMRQAADQIRSAAEQRDGSASGAAKTQTANAAATEQDIARALDKIADSLAPSPAPGDEAARKLADQRDRAQELHERIDRLGDQIEKLQAQSSDSNANSAAKAAGDRGREGAGRAGGGAGASDPAQLRDEYLRQLQQAQDLLRQLQRDDPTLTQGGNGLTFDSLGMTLSAPGTEAFKQDFSRWQQLRRQATEALDHAEQALSKKLQEKQARDRLAAGAEDKAPPAYQGQVDDYFRALAARKQP